jgi:hypothetical protein
MNMDAPTVVCVLGAPRSGTSLTTRILNLLGVDLGPEQSLRWPVPASPLWEHRQIVELNERLLGKLGGESFAPPVPEPGWERSEAFAAERAEARGLLADTFSGAALWGWKDPRTCVTLPFWQQLVPAMHYVICLRNPLDAIASTLRHMPISRQQLLRTWLVYVASALANTAGSPRTLVSYEEYFIDLDSQLQRLAASAGLPPPADDAVARKRVEDHLRERMWHHRTPLAEGLGEADVVPGRTPLYLDLELSRAVDAGTASAQAASRERSTALEGAVDLYARRLLEALPPQEPALAASR